MPVSRQRRIWWLARYGRAVSEAPANVRLLGGVAAQSGRPDSPVRRFLDQWLPGRAAVAHRWEQELAAAPGVPWRPVDVPVSRALVGQVIEMRIGLDAADRPAYWPLLAFLPPEQLTTVLTAAGYGPPEHELADPQTTDPLLRAWQRVSHPLYADTADERAALRALLAAAGMETVAHRLPDLPAESRRAVHQALHPADHNADPEAEHEPGDRDRAYLTMLTDLWGGYLRHGRAALHALGGLVRPQVVLAPGFAIADLLVGHTLVEIKTSSDPGDYLTSWLDQLLGYLLCDRFDTLAITHLAIYSAWNATVICEPVPAVLHTAGAPDLHIARDHFHRALGEDIARAAATQLHR